MTAAVTLFDVVEPPKPEHYRGWAVWWDQGHYEHGIVYRATKWRAKSPAGDLIENPDQAPGQPIIDGFAWLKAEIDRRLG